MLIVECADVLAWKVLLLLLFEFVLFVIEWCTHWSFGCGQEFCCSQLQCLWYRGKIIKVSVKCQELSQTIWSGVYSKFIIRPLRLHTSVCNYYILISIPFSNQAVSLLIDIDYNNLSFRMGIFFWQLTDVKQTQQDWN